MEEKFRLKFLYSNARLGTGKQKSCFHRQKSETQKVKREKERKKEEGKEGRKDNSARDKINIIGKYSILYVHFSIFNLPRLGRIGIRYRYSRARHRFLHFAVQAI